MDQELYKDFLTQRTAARIRAIQIIRFFISVSFFLGFVLFRPVEGMQSPMYVWLLYTSLAYFLFSSILIFLYFFNVIQLTPSYAIIQLAFDFLFFALVILFTAGVQSQFKYLFWLLIFYSGILFHLEGAILAAVVAGFLYAVMVNINYFVEKIRFLDFLPLFPETGERMRIVSVLTICFGFIIIGAISYLVGKYIHDAEYEGFVKKMEVGKLRNKIQESEKLASLGEMAARIAHEIRNPLTSISAAIQMLSTDRLDSDKKEQMLSIANKEVSRLNTMIEDFLHYTKPVETLTEKLYISELLGTTLTLFEQGNPNIQIQWNNRVQNEQMVQLDPHRMKQLFWNVLNNASEAMNNQGTIDIEFTPHTDHQYKISFRDQGHGIEGVDQKFFEPFFTTKAKGTGLGLSIVHRIAKDHNADIQLFNNADAPGATLEMIIAVQGAAHV